LRKEEKEEEEERSKMREHGEGWLTLFFISSISFKNRKILLKKLIIFNWILFKEKIINLNLFNTFSSCTSASMLCNLKQAYT
jgi:hypothetical protein